MLSINTSNKPFFFEVIFNVADSFFFLVRTFEHLSMGVVDLKINSQNFNNVLKNKNKSLEFKTWSLKITVKQLYVGKKECILSS